MIKNHFFKTLCLTAGVWLLGTLGACGRKPAVQVQTYRYRQSNLSQLDRNVSKRSVRVPKMIGSQIKTLSSQQNVRSIWPVTDANHDLVNFQGYRLAFAVMNHGTPRIHLLYQKRGTRTPWRDAGPALKRETEGAAGTGRQNRRTLAEIRSEGTGSAARSSFSHVRLFYTGITASPRDHRSADQLISTVKLRLRLNHGKPQIVHGDSTDHHVINTAAGRGYQTYHQYGRVFRAQSKFGTDPNKWQFINRDPHYVESYGHKYLIFESYVPVRKNSSVLALDYDAEIGMVRLNDRYQIQSRVHPLVTFRGIAHAANQPVLFQQNGSWYLFCNARTSQLSNVHWMTHRYSMLLGFRARKITGPYRPLNNGGGLVMAERLDPQLKDFVSSYMPLDSGSQNHLVGGTYFINHRRQTLAPGLRLKISGRHTTTLPIKINR